LDLTFGTMILKEPIFQVNCSKNEQVGLLED